MQFPFLHTHTYAHMLIITHMHTMSDNSTLGHRHIIKFSALLCGVDKPCRAEVIWRPTDSLTPDVVASESPALGIQ